MATYIVKKNGERINIIVIDPEQVAKYETITGYDLEPVEAVVDAPVTDSVNETMEKALNEMGVVTRE